MADVSVDATIDTETARGMRALVYTTDQIGYMFYIDSDGVFGYSKTTDGGASWGAQVNVDGAGALTTIAFDVWFDKWTSGDTGTLIHTWWFDSTNDIVRWRTLDTNGDTLGTVRAVFTGASAVLGRGAFVSGTKTLSGYLYCAFDIDAGAERGLHRSIDSGTTWSANLATTFVEATLDTCKLYPAHGTGDNNDCWAVYYDASATALTLKLWDSSAASATESATIQTKTDGASDLTGQFGYDAQVRWSDGHLIIATVSLRDNASSTHQVFDCTSTASIATKTAITTNIDDHYYPQMFIDQGIDHLYVMYNGKRDGSEQMDVVTKIYYTKSTDGGTTWTAGDTAYSEAAAAVNLNVWTPQSGPRFAGVWRVAGTLLTNKVNSLVFQLVRGDTIAAGSGVNVPSVAVGDVTVVGDTIAVGSSANAPSAVITDQAVTTETIAVGSSVTAPEEVEAELPAQAVTGDTIAAGSVVTAPTVVPGDVTVVGTTLAAGSVVFEPTVVPGAVIITGETVAATSQVFDPTVAPGAVTVSGETVATTAQVFAVTVTVGDVAVITTVIGTTVQLFAPSMTAVALGATITSTSGVFAVSVAGEVSAPTIGSAEQVFAASVALEQTVLAVAIASGSEAFASTVTVGDVAVTGATVTTTAQVFEPTVLGAGALGGAFISSTAQVFAQTVLPGAVEVTGDHIASTVQVIAPTVTPGAVITGGVTVSSTAQVFAPTVFLEGAAEEVTGAFISTTAALFAVSVVADFVTATCPSTAIVFPPSVVKTLATGLITSSTVTVRYLVRSSSVSCIVGVRSSEVAVTYLQEAELVP